MSAKEESSPTCQALMLGKTCCLTITFFFCPFILIQLGLIKCHPGFSILSLVILPPTCFYLMWLMALEFLMCVIAWFVTTTLQLIVTICYLIRRRQLYRENWLSKVHQDTDQTASNMVGEALGSLNGRIRQGTRSFEASGREWNPRCSRSERDSGG